MKKLSLVSRIAETALIPVSNVLLIGITIMVFAEVVTRYVFGQCYGFLEEFSTWSQVWFTYLLMGVVAKARQHIAVDILPRRLSERQKTAWLISADIVTLVFAIVLGWSGVEVCQNLKELELISATTIPTPVWIVRLCIPLGAAFLAFFSIEQLAADIGSLGKRPEGEK